MKARTLIKMTNDRKILLLIAVPALLFSSAISTLSYAQQQIIYVEPPRVCPPGTVEVTASQPCLDINTGPKWEKRWGAIAVDSVLGKFGGSEGHSSKGDAQKAAVGLCKANGGSKDCKVTIAYYNQCGALAWGDRYIASSNGPDLDKTIESAVATCSQGAPDCQAYYAGCSYAEEALR
jgi:Domain of unknown function (DUF4189)